MFDSTDFVLSVIPSKWVSLGEERDVSISLKELSRGNPIGHWFPSVAHEEAYGVRYDYWAWAVVEIVSHPEDTHCTYMLTTIDQRDRIRRYKGVKDEPTRKATEVVGVSPEAEEKAPVYPERVVPERPSHQGPMVPRRRMGMMRTLDG